MARITIEDCLKKIKSQYDLVLLAKERTSQLNAGEQSLVPKDNDKNTVISLREIAEGKISIKTIEDTAINKLRKQHEESNELEELDEEADDSFDKMYKGEVSKSGTAILPSKRVRKIPEKFMNQSNDSNPESKKETDKEKEEVKDQKTEVEQTDQ